MKYLKYGFAFIMLAMVCFLLFIIVQWTMFDLWRLGGEYVMQPDATILATAEYLYDNPQPLPNQMALLHPETADGFVCVSVGLGLGNWLFARWFLNGERVPYEMHRLIIFNESYSDIYCLEIYQLPPSLHLVEVQVNDSPFYTAMSYKFAIKVEPSPTPSPTPSAP
jgi:hypothetical protein